LAHVQVPGGFPLYTYWALVFYLAVIIGVFVVVASDSTQTYHVALVGYLGCGLVLSTSAVNGLIHTSQGAKEAAAAGFILLSMVTVRLPFYCDTGQLLAD
jgi:SHO1 osmosensor